MRETWSWGLRDALLGQSASLVLCVRKPGEFAQARIRSSIKVPRGVLEQACDRDHDETLKELLTGKMRPIRAHRPRASPIAFAYDREESIRRDLAAG